MRLHVKVAMGLLELLPKLPNVSLWETIVTNYAPCKPSVERDVERAIAGAMGILERCIPGGVLHGLPIFFSDFAIITVMKGDFARRIGYLSWSWVG